MPAQHTICPAQPTELLPLPEGVGEEVPVICNSRSGVLLLRSQRILHNGSTMSASRFETICGKGDAKKWKCSVHLEPSPGVSGQVLLSFICMHAHHHLLPRLASKEPGSTVFVP